MSEETDGELSEDACRPRRPRRPRRPHTGRRRNDAAREAILDATFDLMYTGEADNITIDAIARAAGVGRQTIYRWWPSKGAVAAEAMTRRARAIVPARDTGSLRGDLTAFLTDSFAGLEDERLRNALRQLITTAQRDEHVAAVVADFTAARRAALRELLERGQARGDLSPGADLAMLVDMAYGVLWYRVLIRHAPLDAQAAESLAACLLAAGVR
jgi:AcrR family transcriptional regulator